MAIQIARNFVGLPDATHKHRAKGISPSAATTHAIEDVLIGIAIAAFAIDKRVSRDLLIDVARALLEARSDCRAQELITAAKVEANSLPDWECSKCNESNPGTFELCWNCFEPLDIAGQQLSSKAETVLAIESTMLFGHESVNESESD